MFDLSILTVGMAKQMGDVGLPLCVLVIVATWTVRWVCSWRISSGMATKRNPSNGGIFWLHSENHFSRNEALSAGYSQILTQATEKVWLSLNRRKFLQATAIGTAAVSLSARSYGRILNANERIRLAQIGCGGRGIGRT